MRIILLFGLLVYTPLACSAQSAASTEKVSGIDKSLFSESVDAGDNFYLHANEQWLSTTEIPGDKSNYGIFTMLNDQTQQQVRTLIEAAAESHAGKGSAAQKVGDLYNSVLNVKARNEAGIEPIGDLLKLVAGIESKRDVATVMGKLSCYQVGMPLVPYVSIDAKNSDAYAVYLTQSGLTMPDRDYYLSDEERYVKMRDELGSYVQKMLRIAEQSDPQRGAESVAEIEAAIAAAHWTKTENRDPDKTYNKRKATKVDDMLGTFAWPAFAEAGDLGELTEFVVRQPSYTRQLGKIFDDVSVQQWQDYLAFKVIDSYANYLSEPIERAHFDFHSTVITGVAEQEPLWKRGVNLTGSVVGELVGQLYVEKHFKPAAKKRMDELVDNLKRAFETRIHTRDWMGEGTKKQALEKLSMFTTKIGYPDKWKDYAKLEIQPDASLATNVMQSAIFEHQRELAKLGGPIDRSEWHMTPQTINAYYNPTMNEIVFPAAILQPPFFNMDADDAVNYGAIGAVIGHELSHGFDDKGSKYDGKGNLRKWWTQSDRDEFERRANQLSEQYDQFEPVPGNYVNGKLTLGENIGDLGGLSVAYEAYQLSLEGEPAPEIDGLSGDQRFFLGWSQIWRRLYRQPELLRRLVVDPHSPSEYRVNGIVRNMDAWYEAFNIKPDDELYLEPEQRVRIW
jgi:endothelin-converting enzyme/putative endopeptidase